MDYIPSTSLVDEYYNGLPAGIRRHLERFGGREDIHITNRGIEQYNPNRPQKELMVSYAGLMTQLIDLGHPDSSSSYPTEIKWINSTLGMLGELMFCVRDKSACDYHRISLPYLHYRNILPKNRVFVFNRLPPFSLTELAKMKKEGWKLVCDVDDHFILDNDHYLLDSYIEQNTSQNIAACVRMADVVTVTNAHIAKVMQKYNKNVVIVPNALPFDEAQFTLTKTRYGSTPFIYAGGASHFPDVKLLAGTIDPRYFTLAGYELGHPEWNKMLDMMKGCGTKDHQPLKSYMNLYNSHMASVAPLRKTDFNVCKSNLKVLEAGAKGIPIVTSKVHPYDNPKDRKYVIYAQSTKDWIEQLNRLKADKWYAEDKGLALAEHVRKHYHLKDANEIRRQVMESL